MKVLYVIDSLATGGAQKHLVQLAKGLVGRCEKQTIVALNGGPRSHLTDGLTDCGIEVVRLNRFQVLSGVGLLRLAALIRHERPEVVVTFLFASSVLARPIARACGVPRIITAIQARNANFSTLKLGLLRLTARWSDAFVSNSQGAVAFAVGHEGALLARLTVIPNAVEGASPCSREERDALRKRRGLPGGRDTAIIGSLGRLDRQKGFDLLLKALPQVAYHEGSLYLAIGGDGPERAALEALADDVGLRSRILLPGERSDVQEWVSCLDLYVQPSRFEGTPNAVMEAMGVGVPVVAARVDGVPEIIEDGVTGWLVPPEDPDFLAAAISRALQNEEQREAVGEAGRASMAPFTVIRLAERWLEVFSQR